MKIVSIEEIKERINNQFPNQPYIIKQYTGVTKPFSIQCLKCDNINSYSSFNNFLQKGQAENKKRKYLCTCYNQNNKNNIHKNNEEKIISLCSKNNKIKFISFDYRENSKKYCVNVFCKECHQIYNKDFQSFINNQDCPFCFSKHNLNTLGFKSILPNEYTLLSEYNGTENKVLIKHECGFIWKVKPHSLIQKINNGYLGCPKCNHKQSKGELRISNCLKNKNILYIQEQSFEWQTNKRYRYDFYLPDYNLVIEYMGKQHYEEIAFFHDTLQERQEHDEIKRVEAINNNLHYLAISYKDYNNIETILNDWFNDYPARE